MIVYPLPQQPNGRDTEFVIRLDRTITRIGLPLGLDGNPLADRFPEADTHDDIIAVCDLLADLPVELRDFDRGLAYRMCQAAVFGRTRNQERRASA